MNLAGAIACLLAEAFLVAVLSARPVGAWFGLALALLGLLLPVETATSAFPRTLLAALFVLMAFRAWDLANEQPIRPFSGRLRHLISAADSRLMTPVPRRFDGRAAARVIIGLAIGFAALRVGQFSSSLTGWPHYAMRWGAGALFAFPVMEAVVGTFELIQAAVGVSTPALHDAPHRSLTLTEFWGERWNRIVGRLLEQRVFRPLARWSPWLALIASFALSAAFHAYMIGISLGILAALSWAAFFLAQPPLIAVERRLGVRRWPAAAGAAWTLGTLLLLSPLMTEPALDLFF